jgi:hypothetical protein
MRYDYSSIQKPRLSEDHIVNRDVEKQRDDKRERSDEIALLVVLVGLACGAILTAILR